MEAYNIYDFVYNRNGDLTSKTDTLLNQTTSYTYDVFGQLTQVTLPSKSIVYEIDPIHRRLGKKVNNVLQARYIHSSEGKLIAELDGSGNLTKTFVYASKSHVPDYFLDASGNKYRIFSDHLGSVRLIVRLSDGAVMQRMEHDEFGRVITDTSPGYTPFGFAGGLYDQDTKLVRFGARDYDPETGRWTSKDPILFAGKMANLYGYSFNDPVNFIDPSGFAPGDIFPTESEAAADAINFINPTSVSQNREYGGYIYRTPTGFVATNPNPGTNLGTNLGPFPPTGTASYHTHGAYDPSPGLANNRFSVTDILSDAFSGLNGYLGIYSGEIKAQQNGRFKRGLQCQ